MGCKLFSMISVMEGKYRKKCRKILKENENSHINSDFFSRLQNYGDF